MKKTSKAIEGLKVIFLLPSMVGGLLTPLILAYVVYQWWFHGRYFEYIPWLILFYCLAVLVTSFSAKKYYKVGVYAEFVEGHFNWLYLASIPATLYMLYAVIFEDATWANLIYVLAVGTLSRVFANFHRALNVAHSQTLVKLGIENPPSPADSETDTEK